MDTLSDDEFNKDFGHYYPPSTEELDGFWKRAVVSVDSNVLLNIHRYPDSSREGLLKVLEGLADHERLWIPYQVALEYHWNRDGVIRGQSKDLRELVDFLEKTESSILKQYEKMHKRHVSFLPDPFSSRLRKFVESEISEVKSLLERLEDRMGDPMTPRVAALFRGRTGTRYDQKRIDEIQREGKERYAALCPPGFGDLKGKSGKRRDDSDGQEDRPEYRQGWGAPGYLTVFGDLILWKQLLEGLAGKEVVFITDDDTKEDWYAKKEGRRYPRPELLAEARQVGGIKLWISKSTALLKRFQAEFNIPEEAISDAKEFDAEHRVGRGYRWLTGPEISNLHFGTVSDSVQKWTRILGGVGSSRYFELFKAVTSLEKGLVEKLALALLEHSEPSGKERDRLTQLFQWAISDETNPLEDFAACATARDLLSLNSIRPPGESGLGQSQL